MIYNAFSKTPDWVNEVGVKWWFDSSITDYAIKEDLYGNKLDDIIVYLIETPEGYQTRLLIQNGIIIKEATSLEDICCTIDMLKIAKRF